MKVFSLLLTFFASLALINPVQSLSYSQLNVYAINNIGSESQAYSGSDFEGVTAAGGNAYFNGFSINANNTVPGNPYSLYTGGNVNFNSGSVNNGGIAAGGTININSVTVYGSMNSGGNLNGSSGQVFGNASLTGSNNAGPGLVINGAVQTGVSYSAPLNLASTTQFFQQASSAWAAATPTASFQNVFGQIVVSALQSGRNILNITASDYNAAYGIKVVGAADAFLIINILGNNYTSLAPLSTDLSGGVTYSNLLLNLPDVTQLSINGSVNSNLLAPNANFNYSGGTLTGSLVAYNINGSGQVNDGHFLGYTADPLVNTPEPATYVLLASVLLVCFFMKNKKANVVMIVK